MVAGIGAGVAAAAAVGQMIVAAVSLGNQDANDREVQALKSKLETMQQKLEEKGYLAADNTAKAVAAKERVAEADSFADLVALSKSLDRKVEKLKANTGGSDPDSSTPARRPRQVSEARSLGGRGGDGLC
ncbi:hypothetical protein LTR24_007282 [Lithohypha guttulata]|uniref:Uncharacterized protein n=1 Tax=Lithohypha guttulata TaxID=1690604 RepID=A0ABR0K3S3_9EURO|nr:hypothetical protein LTR24_007282 [Lithohypha guttulata]